MNYQAFTNASLTTMHHGIRGALAADDALGDLGAECKFRIRETQDRKVHAAALEAEMVRRGMLFDVIDWSEDQATLLVAEPNRQRGRALRWPALSVSNQYRR